MKTRVVFIALMIAAIIPALASAASVVEEPGKQWEFGLSVGYADFRSDQADDAAIVGLRILNRIRYPFLVGFGADASVIGDVRYFAANVPVIVRIGLYDRLKLDAVVSAGIAYAKNKETDVSKTMAVGTAGLELKHFIAKGHSIGVGGYYSLHSDSDLNMWRLAFLVSF